MIVIKSKKEIEIMRQRSVVAGTLERLAGLVKPGITTAALDRFAEDYLARQGAKPSFKGYNGFPASICASVNREVVHGIPGERRLEEGDIISIDLGAIIDGWHGDAAITVPVGEVDPEIMRLIKVTEESLYLGIKAAQPGVRLGVVSSAIQNHVQKAGFSVVRQYVGHGIGRQMHEDPPVPNFGRRIGAAAGGMTIAIELTVNAGDMKSC